MKIAVVGMGAVGGFLAGRLAEAGFDVAALARGATLAALRERGLRVLMNGRELNAPVHASDDARELGPQDLVIVALKGPALAAAAQGLQPLLGPQTMVMPAMNGVPWWFLQTGAPGASAERLASIDPDGRIEAAIPLARVLGCVVHFASASPQPGVVEHGFGDRLIVGEPAGSPSGRASARTNAVCAALAKAGFKTEASTDIRHDIWFKLWGNMTMNPVSALTGATTDHILDDPLVHAFILQAMEEAAAIGAHIGCRITQSGEERMAVTRQLGGFKTSMLQDTQAGRALELDALVGSVHEIGARFGVAMPNIGALLGLTRLMARERGLYPL
jgi:2-dehydropantoate 2-reductase